MLPGGVISDVKGAAGDDVGEAREASFPERSARAGLGDRTFRPRRLFTAGASIDHQGQARGEQRQEVGFDMVGEALASFLAYSQADRNVGAVDGP